MTWRATRRRMAFGGRVLDLKTEAARRRYFRPPRPLPAPPVRHEHDRLFGHQEGAEQIKISLESDRLIFYKFLKRGKVGARNFNGVNRFQLASPHQESRHRQSAPAAVVAQTLRRKGVHYGETRRNLKTVGNVKSVVSYFLLCQCFVYMSTRPTPAKPILRERRLHHSAVPHFSLCPPVVQSTF